MNDASNVPVLIKTQVPEDPKTVLLERYVTVGGHDVKRRAKAPVIEDQSSPELALYVHHEFMDLAGTSQLSLTTGILRFEYFRQVLKGTAQTHWDAAALNVGGTNLENFATAVKEWFGQYMEPTAYHDQKQYFLTATKPFAIGCKQLASRLLKIKSLMRNMPGAPEVGTDIYSEIEFKMLYYNLMRNEWKTNFDASGNVITEADFKFTKLVSYMAAQERRENTNRSNGRGNRFAGRGTGRNMRGRAHQGHQGRSQSYSGYSRPYYGSYGSPGRYVQRYPYDQSGPPSQRARHEYRSPSRGYGSPRGFGSPRSSGGRFNRGGSASRDGRSNRDSRGYSPRRLNFTPRGNRSAGRYHHEGAQETTTGTFVTDETQHPEYEEHKEHEEPHWAEEHYGVFEEEEEQPYEHGGYGEYAEEGYGDY